MLSSGMIPLRKCSELYTCKPVQQEKLTGVCGARVVTKKS